MSPLILSADNLYQGQPMWWWWWQNCGDDLNSCLHLSLHRPLTKIDSDCCHANRRKILPEISHSLASDWLKIIMWPRYWPLIGRDFPATGSRDAGQVADTGCHNKSFSQYRKYLTIIMTRSQHQYLAIIFTRSLGVSQYFAIIMTRSLSSYIHHHLRIRKHLCLRLHYKLCMRSLLSVTSSSWWRSPDFFSPDLLSQ